jgi:hypothetical protein
MLILLPHIFWDFSMWLASYPRHVTVGCAVCASWENYNLYCLIISEISREKTQKEEEKGKGG